MAQIKTKVLTAHIPLPMAEKLEQIASLALSAHGVGS